MRSTRKTALYIVFVALLLRGALLPVVVRHPERMFHPDSRSYTQPAVNLLNGHGFSRQAAPPYLPDTVRTPVYPLFIAALYAIFGARPTVIAGGAQVLLSTITAGLAYLMGRELLSEKTAQGGALLLAVNLGTVVYSLSILTETLFTALLVLSGCALIRYRISGRAIWVVMGGGISGIAILCRPIALFFPLLMAPMFAWSRPAPWLERTKMALIFVAIVGIAIAPWMMRNDSLVGSPTLSTITTRNLLLYNAVSLEAWIRDEGQAQVRAEVKDRAEAELARRGASDDESARLQLYREWGRETILAHPWQYAYVHLKNDLNSLLPNVTELLELLGVTRGAKGTLSVLNQRGLWAAVSHYFGNRTWLLWLVLPFLGTLGLTYVGAVAGIAVLARRGSWFALAMLVAPCAYFLLIPGAPSHPRFRVPVMPYLCLLAASGLVSIWNWKTARLGR